MKSSMSVLVASLILISCGTSKESSVKGESHPQPMRDKVVANCEATVEKDAFQVSFVADAYSSEIRATLYKNDQYVNDLNVCAHDYAFSLKIDQCHDVNFTDTYTATLERSGFSSSITGELSYVGENKHFSADLTCTSNN
ncbi:MAG: hypothetical protein AB7T49_05335 [Oligoflexales bacterium]